MDGINCEFIETYYRVKVLKDMLANDIYISTKELEVILGFNKEAKDEPVFDTGYQE